MNCKKCGNPLNENERMCMLCGTMVDGPEISSPLPQQPQMNTNQPTEMNNMGQQTQANPFEQFGNQPQVNNNPGMYYNSQFSNPTQPVLPYQNAQQPPQPKKGNGAPNKPLLIMVGCVALFALVVIGIALFKPVDDEIVLQEDGTRTVMVYMIGSDLESKAGAATKDINEMIKSKFDTESVNVVLYTGGTKRWRNDTIDKNENAIYEVTNTELVKKKSFDKEIMTNNEPLTEFIDYVYDNYDSDLYDLILWDHGAGPMFGYGLDENDIKKSAMSLEMINEALDDTKLIKNTKFEFIGFDACLMGSIEVAYSLKDYANYLIASEELEPGAGWNYNFLSTITEETTSKELGTKIIDDFFKYYENLNYNGNITLSMVDLYEVDNLISEIDNLFSKADGAIVDLKSFSKYSKKLTRKTVYGNIGRASSSYDLVDLKDLTNSISDEYPKETASLNAALDDTIVYSKDNMSNTNGLSIYFPTMNKALVDKMVNKYKEVRISKGYYDFLKSYASYITGNRAVDSNGYRATNPLYSAESVSVELPKDLVENYESADYVIFRKVDNNNYIPVYKSSNLSLDNNVLSTVPNNQQLIVNNTAGTNPGWATMYEVSREDGYAIYSVAAILERYDEEIEEESERLQFENVNIFYKVKDGETEGTIVDVQPINDGDTASKTNLDINEWEKIQFFNTTYKLYDASNNYLSDWESSKVYYISTYNIAEGFNLKFVGLDHDLSTMEIKNFDGTVIPNTNQEYYYMFRVTDTQGEVHQMNLVKVG